MKYLKVLKMTEKIMISKRQCKELVYCLNDNELNIDIIPELRKFIPDSAIAFCEMLVRCCKRGEAVEIIGYEEAMLEEYETISPKEYEITVPLNLDIKKVLLKSIAQRYIYVSDLKPVFEYIEQNYSILAMIITCSDRSSKVH